MPVHPLVPLRREGFRRNLDVLRASGRLTPSMRFAGVVLAEPPKAEVLSWRTGDPVPRRARSIVRDRADHRTHVVVVDLGAGVVERFEHLPGVTPNSTLDEFHEIARVLAAEPRVVAALASSGTTCGSPGTTTTGCGRPATTPPGARWTPG